jgi:hypothetical protein
MLGILSLLALMMLVRATRRVAGTAFLHPMVWGWAAWLAWLTCYGTRPDPAFYLALCVTACAGVAVLGARRPGVWAWHAVVAGLLVVLLLPLAEGALTRAATTLEGARGIFLAAVLAVGIGNYLPTRFWGGAAAMTAACSLAVYGLALPGQELTLRIAVALAVLSPLAARLTAGNRTYANPFNRTWAEFRDRDGAVWAHRVREQFNAAARNAGVTVELSWHGGRGLSSEKQAAAEELLAALIRRFGV